MYVNTRLKKCEKYKIDSPYILFLRDEISNQLIDLNSLRFYRCRYRPRQGKLLIEDRIDMKAIITEDAVHFCPLSMAEWNGNDCKILAIYDSYKDEKYIQCEPGDAIDVQ